MGSQLLCRTVAVVVACSLAGPANAQVRAIARSSGWEAYGGLADDNRKLCGVSAQGGGRWIGMKYFERDQHFTVHLSNSAWRVRPGRRVLVTTEFDDRGGWEFSATTFRMPSGDAALSFEIPTRMMKRWLDQFEASDVMYVGFPNDDDWEVDLAGTPQALIAFGVCVAALLLSN